MIIDTEIRHVTKAGDNIFLDLGFSKEEANNLYAQSEQQINNTKVLKEQLMTELSTWIDNNHYKQTEAAQILGVTRPRVSDLVNKKSSKFTFDALINMLSKTGKSVELIIN